MVGDHSALWCSFFLTLSPEDGLTEGRGQNISQMSPERLTASCSVPLLPVITERPDDKSDFITRKKTLLLQTVDP
jgi:hypothetical protein